MSSRRTLKAFTLVELLVVIGIIALLISILLPALSKARMQGNWAVCLSNLKQVGAAMTMYANDNKGWLPRPASNGQGAFADDFINWRKTAPSVTNFPLNDSCLAKYLNASNDKLEKVFRCPGDVPADRPAQSGFTEPYLYSYSMNRGFDQIDPVTLAISSAPGSIRRKITQMIHSSEKILVIEEINPNDGRWEYSNVATSDALASRHAEQGNILWGDTHVTRLKNENIVQHPEWCTPFQ